MIRRSRLTWIVAASFLVAGCGARTSEDDLLDYWGSSSDGGSASVGGRVGTGGWGTGGIASGGATIPVGGGFPTGGTPTSGGSPSAGGNGPMNSCCVTSSIPGCSDVMIQECVCSFDVWCCNNSWDQTCVQEAEFQCGAGCFGTGGSGVGGSGGSTGGAASGGASSGGSSAGGTSSGGSSSGGASSGGASSGGASSGGASSGGASSGGSSTGGSNSGDCCEPHGGMGCEVPETMSCVCLLDNFCCDDSWDAICVGEAVNFCMASCDGTGGSGTGGTGNLCDAAYPDTCGSCLCNNCNDAFSDCIGDAACMAVAVCAANNGCTGLECLQVAECRARIRDAGGISDPSVLTALDLAACGEFNGCDCP